VLTDVLDLDEETRVRHSHGRAMKTGMWGAVQHRTPTGPSIYPL
jgi:hypothetical protein